MIVVCTFLTGSVKSVQFSPDPAALQSILQNEGVKAGGPVGTTPRSSVCPPSRATSIYTVNLCSLLYFLILVTLLLLLFLLFKCCLWNNFFCLQAQRVPVRKNRPEATAVPASKMQHCSTLISLSFQSDVTWLFSPEQQHQQHSKRRRWTNGPHRESATPDISPCLLWSVCIYCMLALCPGSLLCCAQSPR